MKYMILTYGSQQEYDAMAGQGPAEMTRSAEDLAAMGSYLETFTADLAESCELVEASGLTAPALARRVQLRPLTELRMIRWRGSSRWGRVA